jgi:predicted DNA-binding transcriptional regulator AlpA
VPPSAPSLLDDLPPYLSSTQLAELFGVNRATILEWAHADVLPRPIQLGPRCLRWPREQIAAHLERLQAGEGGAA